MKSRLASFVLASLLAASPTLAQEKVLRIAMTASDVPTTSGMPNNGFEGMRFLGFPVFQGLILFDLTTTGPVKLLPGLAEKWEQAADDKKTWIFHLRKGVKFHDGTDFNADAVIWNLDKVLNDKAPQFDKRQSAQVKTRLPSVKSYSKIDDYTVEITTKTVDSFFPYQMLWFLISSPTQWEKLDKDWNKFASEPSGTGPFKLARLVPRERAELVKNEAYWNPKRIPKTDRMILVVAPEAATRTAALLSGTVDLIETPFIERELMLVKVTTHGTMRDEVVRLCDIFRGRILDVTPTSYVIEVTGEKTKLDAVLRALGEENIIEVVRSGTTGILRGDRGFSA